MLRGRDAVAVGLGSWPLSGAQRWRMTPTRASGQLAAMAYRLEGGSFIPHHLAVLTLQGALIDEINTVHDPPAPFEPTVGFRRLTESLSITRPQPERSRRLVVNRRADVRDGRRPGAGLGTLGWFAGVVMMAAMMLPSLAPATAVYATLTRRREISRWLLFAGGYLLVWSAAGVVAYGLFELGRGWFGGDLAWNSGGRWLSGAVLALAAVYQLTPLKGASLAKCRSPLRVLRGSWREGWLGAVGLGVRTGGWCIGCTWALMTTLFALGVMSLTWMALVAALVALEKVGPAPRAARVATAAVLAALTIGVLAAPHDVPGLVVPGSPAGMHAMQGMG